MDLQHLDKEAREAALKDIKNMLQRPGQLEKVEQYIQKKKKKKASVEALLKTGLQNQLDGVRVGLKQLETCMQDVSEVRERILTIESLVYGIPEIYDALGEVREENTKHSQYATAIENLKHIFNVEVSVQKTMTLIDEDKLLNAHQCLADLENSRDDLLYELHKQPKQHASDKITLKRHFEKVETVSQSLEKKIRLILSRALNTVRKEPTVIVTALRIIEREEKNDQFALQQQKVTGFLPPGRPKKWRNMAMNVLQEAVITRIEGSKLEERADNKMWLVRDLEILRQIILEDLRVVKSLCVPCFPPHYNIFNEYVKMYHEGLSSYLDNIAKSGLEGNEYVSMLSWVMNTYPGHELMSHPDLNVDVQQLIGPLLRPEHLKSLEGEYLRNMQRNYQDWMTKAAETERQEWFSEQMPDQHDQFYHTSAPVIIFQMIDQHLQVTNTIHSELTFKALIMSIQQVEIFGQTYLKNVIELKEHHFRNRDQIKYFTHYIITIVNNSQQMVELAQQMKQLYWPKSRTEHYEDFEKLLATFQRIRAHAASYLLEEAFLDMERHFNELFTPKWLLNNLSVETICATLDDYFHDYNHLRPINFEMVINEAQKLLAKRYIRALLSKRISKPRSECDEIVHKINQEHKRFKQFFEKIAPNISMTDSPLDLLPTLSGLLVSDIELLVLDLHTLLGSYPSLSEDQIVRLFYIRNDVKAAEVREKVQDAMKSKKSMDHPASQVAHLAEQFHLDEQPSTSRQTPRVRQRARTDTVRVFKNKTPKQTNSEKRQPAAERAGKIRRTRSRNPYLPALGEPGGRDDPIRKGLSGSGVRWYLRFLQRGHSPVEARRLAEEHRTKPSRYIPPEVLESMRAHRKMRQRIEKDSSPEPEQFHRERNSNNMAQRINMRQENIESSDYIFSEPLVNKDSHSNMVQYPNLRDYKLKSNNFSSSNSCQINESQNNLVQYPDLSRRRNEPSRHATDSMRSIQQEEPRSRTNEPQRLRVTILPKNYPDQSLTSQQLTYLEESILSEVAKGHTSPLVFEGIHFRAGFLVVDCKDVSTAEWLCYAVSRLQHWENFELRACINEESPTTYGATLFFPRSAGQPIEQTLSLLESQNVGLDTDLWKVVGLKNNDQGQLMNTIIGEHSKLIIEANGCALNYKFGKIPVRIVQIRSKSNSPRPEDRSEPNISNRYDYDTQSRQYEQEMQQNLDISNRHDHGTGPRQYEYEMQPNLNISNTYDHGMRSRQYAEEMQQNADRNSMQQNRNRQRDGLWGLNSF